MAMIDTKAELRRLLETEGTVLMLLFGSDATAAGVHATAVEEVETEWRLPALVRDLSILTPRQKTDWSAANGMYVVLGDDRREPADSGSASDLTRQDGSPAIRKISAAFARGEAQ